MSVGFIIRFITKDIEAEIEIFRLYLNKFVTEKTAKTFLGSNRFSENSRKRDSNTRPLAVGREVLYKLI